MKVIIPFLLSFWFSLLAVSLPGQGTTITFSISGYIKTACGHPLPGVEVLGAQTDADGYYSVEVESGEEVSVSPYLPDFIIPGLDSSDLLMLRSIIISQSGFFSPYQALAADLNLDQGVSTFDFVLLFKVINGVQPLDSPPHWLFFPESFAFPDPDDPWQGLDSVHTPFIVSQDTIINFIGVGRGDLDCSTALWPGPAGKLRGRAVIDQDNNCQAAAGEAGYAGWTIQLSQDAGGVFYATTGADGFFEAPLPTGDFRATLVPPNALWAACVDSIPFSITENGVSTIDIPYQAVLDCPSLDVDISAIRLRRCTTNTYQVRYCNSGTATAENAYVEVTFDDHLSVVGSSLPWSSATGQTYTFPLGDIPPGAACGSFSIEVYLDCDALLGQAHCVEAHIFPDSLCEPWPGPQLELEGGCTGDSVQFRIQNLGGDMPAERHFIVIEDDLVMFDGQFQLNSGGFYDLGLPANGATLRLQLEPAPGPGGVTQPGLAVEACGAAGPEGPSLGFVTQYPNEAGNPFVEIDCRENTGPYDPNDKQAFPKGQGSNHLLHPTFGLDYLIRFQNTGTDTAFLVVIRDTLPAGLSPGSLRPGAASHPYAFTLRANGVAEFRFDNIMLPDSSTNLEGSQGFVQFSIEQQPGNPNGAIIENSAAIYFDFNEPIVTNYAWHTIDDGFLLPGEASISGELRNPNGALLGDGARVALIQGEDTLAIDTGGVYHFGMLPTQQPYTVAPYREETFATGNYLNSVTTLDMVLISRHILGVQPIVNPYLLLAADVDYSGHVSSMDMVALRRLILQIQTEHPLSDNPSWRFVRADYVFPDPANPWLEPIPSTAVFDPLLYDEQVDFVGIKVGDINGDATAGRAALKSRAGLPLQMRAERSDDVVLGHAVPTHPGDWVAFQAALQLEPGVILQDVRAGVDAGELGYSISEGGQLRLCWHHYEPVHFPAGAPLFVLEFAPGGLQGEEAVAGLLPGFSQAFTLAGEPFGLTLDASESGGRAIQVFPNPGNGDFSISGQAGAPEVQIRLYSFAGQLLHEGAARGAGRWFYELKAGLLPPGVYTVEARAGEQRWVERLVVLQ